MSAITEKQHGVLGGMIVALVIIAVGLIGVIWFSPAFLFPENNFESRVKFMLAWDLAVVFFLAVGIVTLARYRFMSIEDIDGGGLTSGSVQAKIHQSMLQNHLEQVVFALFVHFTCAILLPFSWMPALPLCVVFFVVGRFLFWWGYHKGAKARALGFALTFYPTVFLFSLVSIRVISTL